jgi:hypothetical protein
MKSYKMEGNSVTDQQVARYERQIEESIEVDVTLEGSSSTAVELQGDISEVYETEEDQLAKGVAFGNYLFEELSEYHWDQDYAARPIFTEMDTMPIEAAEGIVDSANKEFRHGFINSREISDELDLYQLQQRDGVSPAREELYDSVIGSLEENDLTATQIVEMVSEGEIEVDVDSAQYRSWVSPTLNELADRAVIGRYKDGREVKYTSEPERGFRGQVIKSDFDLEQKNNFLEGNRPITESEFEDLIGLGRQPREIMLEFAGRSSWKALNRQDS